MSFEEMLKELGSIVKELETGDLPLDEALEKYKEGVELSVKAAGSLENARLEIKHMSGDVEDE